MKYIKTYEKTIFYQKYKDQKFGTGDYVIVEHGLYYSSPKLKKYIKKTPGQIYDIWKREEEFGTKYTYGIQYKDSPKKIRKELSPDREGNNTILTLMTEGQLRLATPEEIEMIEIKKNAKKYNI
jgi:hypothetical protein